MKNQENVAVVRRLERVSEERLEPMEAMLRTIMRALEGCFRYNQQLEDDMITEDVYRLMNWEIMEIEEVARELRECCELIYDGEK